MYEYDDGGRLLSSRPEPEWDETEQAWMLSLSEYRASLCPICGNPRDICQSPDDSAAFDVPPPTRCQATTAIQLAQNDHEYPNAGALVWAAVPKQRR